MTDTKAPVVTSPRQAFDEVQAMMYRIAFDHGFHSPEKTPLEEVALWHSECSEAAEETRTGLPLNSVYYTVKATNAQMAEAPFEIQEILSKYLHLQDQMAADVPEDQWEMPAEEDMRTLVFAGFAKPEGYGIEAADAVIRIMDSLEAKGISLFEMIELKAAYNETREFMHGKTK